MKSLFVFLIVYSLTLIACNKEDEFVKATIIDGGDIAVDGCGWLIEVSSVTFKPVDLPEELKVDGKQVEIIYDDLDSWADCGFAQDVYQEISLTEIQVSN